MCLKSRDDFGLWVTVWNLVTSFLHFDTESVYHHYLYLVLLPVTECTCSSMHLSLNYKSLDHLEIYCHTDTFWPSTCFGVQVASCAQTAVPSRRYGTVTNTPVQFTTGRQGPGALVLKTPRPCPWTPPRVSDPAVAVRVPALWECRLVRSSASGSAWDKFHPRSKLWFPAFLLFLPLD